MNTMPLHFHHPEIEEFLIFSTCGYNHDGCSFTEDEHFARRIYEHRVNQPLYECDTWYPEQSTWYPIGDGVSTDVARSLMYADGTLFAKFTMTNAYNTMMTDNFLVFSRRNAHKLTFLHVGVDSATPQE